jgi:hypothetical protein
VLKIKRLRSENIACIDESEIEDWYIVFRQYLFEDNLWWIFETRSVKHTILQKAKQINTVKHVHATYNLRIKRKLNGIKHMQISKHAYKLKEIKDTSEENARSTNLSLQDPKVKFSFVFLLMHSYISLVWTIGFIHPEYFIPHYIAACMVTTLIEIAVENEGFFVKGSLLMKNCVSVWKHMQWLYTVPVFVSWMWNFFVYCSTER